MKAVIPAAGLGTRFLPATKAQPKEMLPVVDKPVIQYVVEEAVSAGVDDILMITGRGKRAIEDHFDRSVELEQMLMSGGSSEGLSLVLDISMLADIHYIRQKSPLGLGHAVLCAEKHVGRDPCIVMLGDVIIVDHDCLPRLIELYERYKCSVIAVERVDPALISSYGVIDGEAIEDGVFEIRNLVEKPPTEKAPSNLAIFGRYLLTPAIFKHLKNTKPGKNGEIQLTDGLCSLLSEERILALEVGGKAYDIGNRLAWVKANIALGLDNEEMGEPLMAFLRSISGPSGICDT
jgi:UTP--glucose-1-phosphate uridylyltransferase